MARFEEGKDKRPEDARQRSEDRDGDQRRSRDVERSLREQHRRRGQSRVTCGTRGFGDETERGAK